MKVLKSEVKTIYTIEYTKDEMAEAKGNWLRNQNLEQTRFPKAFDNEDLAMGTLEKEFKEFKEFNRNGDFAGYMAYHLGFDGWENAGYYNENKKVRTMSVYNNGDTMN